MSGVNTPVGWSVSEAGVVLSARAACGASATRSSDASIKIGSPSCRLTGGAPGSASVCLAPVTSPVKNMYTSSTPSLRSWSIQSTSWKNSCVLSERAMHMAIARAFAANSGECAANCGEHARYCLRSASIAETTVRPVKLLGYAMLPLTCVRCSITHGSSCATCDRSARSTLVCSALAGGAAGGAAGAAGACGSHAAPPSLRCASLIATGACASLAPGLPSTLASVGSA